MSQLPPTRSHEDDNLCNTIPDGSCISRLAQVPIISLPLPLILLLPDLLELDVEVPDLARKATNVRPVVLDVGLSGADDDVEVEADVGVGEPGGVVGGEADGVVTGVVGEAPLSRAGGFDKDVICFRLLSGQTQIE
ncbi:hypothetical protein H0H87_000538, partial [Tephrocybe sp. NHM501043]